MSEILLRNEIDFVQLFPSEPLFERRKESLFVHPLDYACKFPKSRKHYSHLDIMSMSAHMKSFACFSLFQRLVLYPPAHLTMVNLNYILCGASRDPFHVYSGKWYLLISEVYFPFFAYLVKYTLLSPAFLLLKIQSIYGKSKLKP